MATACIAAACTPSTWSPDPEEADLGLVATSVLAQLRPPAVPSYVSIVIPLEGSNQLVGTVLDDPMFLPDADVLAGTPSGWDVFMSVDPAADRPGAGEVDLWDGSNGWDVGLDPRPLDDYGDRRGDLFVLGDHRTPYYAGRTGPGTPDRDVVIITRFDPAASVLRLHGEADDYRVVSAVRLAPLPTQVAALFVRHDGAWDLIAAIDDLDPARLDLGGPNVDWADRPSQVPALDSDPLVRPVDQWSYPGVANAGLVSVDADGNTYVVGMCSGPTPDFVGEGSWCIASYDPTGNRRWARRHGTAAVGKAPYGETMWRILVEDGVVYVAGGTHGAYGGPQPPGGLAGLTAVIAKIDAATGDQLAVRQIVRPGAHSFVWSLTSDGAGHLYAGGGTGFDHPVPPVAAPFVAKVDTETLEVDWLRIPNGGQGELISSETLGGVAFVPSGSGVPGDGTVVASGYTAVGVLFGADPRSNDVISFSYDDEGRLLWGEAWGVPTRHEGPWETVAGPDGEHYVVGVTQGRLDGEEFGGQGDGFIRRMDENGVHVWTRLISTPGSDNVHDVAVAGDLLVVTGDTSGHLAGPNRGESDVWVGVFDRQGNRIAVHQFGTPEIDNVFTLDVLGDRVVLAGHSEGSMAAPNGGSVDVWVAELSLDELLGGGS